MSGDLKLQDVEIDVYLNTTHPRWRGEYVRGTWKATKIADSPPLARGISPNLAFYSPTATHPRWRGEYTSYPGVILAISTFQVQLQNSNDTPLAQVRP